jgi:hypothetical protein
MRLDSGANLVAAYVVCAYFTKMANGSIVQLKLKKTDFDLPITIVTNHTGSVTTTNILYPTEMKDHEISLLPCTNMSFWVTHNVALV